VGELIAVEVADADERPALETLVEREEAGVDRGGQNLRRDRIALIQFVAVDDEDLAAAAGPGAGDDVRGSVAGDVASRHGDAAAEVRIVGEEIGEHRAVLAAEDANVGPAAGARASHDVG